MLQAGLFDDSPHTREIIYNFMRLRALRVEVDVRLALGEFTLEQAAKYLEEKVPMDPGTAHQEAIAFSTAPGTGHYLSDRKTPDHQDAGGGASSTGRRIQPARLPRFSLEKRERADLAPALGVSRPGR